MAVSIGATWDKIKKPAYVLGAVGGLVGAGTLESGTIADGGTLVLAVVSVTQILRWFLGLATQNPRAVAVLIVGVSFGLTTAYHQYQGAIGSLEWLQSCLKITTMAGGSYGIFLKAAILGR